jgi:nitroreductase
MNVLEAIYARRAVRSYSEAPVEPKSLELLIAAAVEAPSANNTQPWHFTVVRQSALLDRISAAAKTHMLHLLDSKGGPPEMRQHLSDPAFHVFYHAPALIVISAKTGDWAIEDASLAAENLMLAACEKGLGTCWIGFAQRWLETDEGKRSIGLQPDFQPVAPIIVGHPSASTSPVPRRAPDVKWID